jgi:hypothetical protein
MHKIIRLAVVVLVLLGTRCANPALASGTAPIERVCEMRSAMAVDAAEERDRHGTLHGSMRKYAALNKENAAAVQAAYMHPRKAAWEIGFLVFDECMKPEREREYMRSEYPSIIAERAMLKK